MNRVTTIELQSPALNPRPWGILGVLILKIVRNYGIGRCEAPSAELPIIDWQFPQCDDGKEVPISNGRAIAH